MQMVFFMLARTFPGLVRKALLKLASLQLGKRFDMRHFSPRYKPWDERVCAVPDGDLFKVLRRGRRRWSPSTSTASSSGAFA